MCGHEEVIAAPRWEFAAEVRPAITLSAALRPIASRLAAMLGPTDPDAEVARGHCGVVMDAGELAADAAGEAETTAVAAFAIGAGTTPAGAIQLPTVKLEPSKRLLGLVTTSFPDKTTVPPL